ncbi:general secretion pathway protein GspE, partial (plasmid) [Xanthomonas citri pv. citri]
MQALDEIKFHTNLVVEPILVADDQLRRTLEAWSNSSDALSNLGGDDDDFGSLDTVNGDEDGDTGVDAKGEDTPVVKFVNKVLVDAIRRGASDIHFEPTRPFL